MPVRRNRIPFRPHPPREAAAARRAGVRRAAVAAVLLPALVGGFALQAWTGDDGSRLFHQVMAHLVNDSPDSLTADALYEKAARGLVESIGDPYAQLYSPRELAEFSREALRGRYGGLGMTVERLSDTVTITRVFPSTPARAAGIRPGDRILAVDGTPVVGWELARVTERLLGEPGTPVRVTLARRGRGTLRLEVHRAAVSVPAVPFATVLEDGIGYLPLEQFSESSRAELESAFAGLRKSGARAFVLDLRGNGGGSLDQAIRISNLFVRRGSEIVRVVYRNAAPEVYLATEEPLVPAGMPVVVLADEGAASASEIVAGALQDHDRAVIVGTTTYGKGLVQDLFQLEHGWALKLTTGKWYTPSGRSIQRARSDTLPPSDSALAARPVYRSGAGRLLYGGGGIAPDLVVRDDTLRGAERALMEALLEHPDAVDEALTEVALELGLDAGADFAVQPAWRERLRARLERAGVRVDAARYDAGGALVDRLLEQRAAGLVFGDSAVFRRTRGRDPQLQAALRVLRGARTQQEAFARVEP
ncbi:MAG TPA: S41 family peptidase [Longimicrobiaceae bacterium]|nr:S41 family peptidase [Longimicrobiaceae bacterium]